MTLNELLAQRRQLVRKLNEVDALRRPLQTQLDEIDKEMFSRFTVLAEALDGGKTQTVATGTVRMRNPYSMAEAVVAEGPTRAMELLRARDAQTAIAGSSLAASHVTAQLTASMREVAERFRTADSMRSPKLITQVLEVLREAGRPMTRNELYELLIAKGIAVPGKDPKANLSAHLSYSDEIMRDSEGRWTIRQREIESDKK